VLNVYMEEFPLVSDWKVLTSTPNVVVVPFFISDGLHSYEDIPGLLGIAEARHDESVDPRKGSTSSPQRTGDEVFRRGPYQIDNRSLFYASSIGTDSRVVDIIVEQAAAFDSIGSRN
jgi:sirohydrochlorin cobaltochelatase